MTEINIPADFLMKHSSWDCGKQTLLRRLFKNNKYIIVPILFYLGVVSYGLWGFFTSNRSTFALCSSLVFMLSSIISNVLHPKSKLRLIFACTCIASILITIAMFTVDTIYVIAIGFFIPVFAQYLFRDFVFSNLTGIIIAFIFLTRRIHESTHVITVYISGIIIVSALYSLVFYLIINIKSERDKYHKVSMMDSLTGLYNLNSIIEIGQDMLNKQYNVSLMVIDMDHFKHINDTYGHMTGNKALVFISALIKKCLEGLSYTMGRLGGDEFIILIKDLDLVKERNLNEKLRNTLKTSIFISDPNAHPIRLSCSTGIAHSRNESEKKIEILLHRADMRMYENKYGRFQIDIGLEAGSELLPERCLQVINAMKEKDMYTFIHSRFVANFAKTLGNALNLPKAFVQDLYIAGWIHDLGKLFISSEILRKQSSLTKAEYEIVKNHVTDCICLIEIFEISSTVKNAVKYHHERYDGKGYPFAMSDKDLPLEGKILAIADMFSALTVKHVYKDSLSFKSAVNELKNCRGKQLDPKLVDVFLKCLNKTIV
ncbi:MAG TPA: diguanylate cyclase [Pseudobacteroides sp.]|uniref:bifunctional diguanylate cyclase/phosphohydrolase n=1 Tax=Pseudobacteroides sp. TaxID=1968840 RepID=UPI002F92BBD5